MEKNLQAKLRGNAIKSNLIPGGIFILLSFLILWVFNWDRVEYIFANQDISKVASETIQEGQFYKVNHVLILDNYATDEKGYYMTILLDDHNLMGLYAYENEQSKLEAIWDETYYYLEEDYRPDLYPKTSMDATGIVTNMTAQERQYFREEMALWGYTEAELDTFLYKTICIIPATEAFTPSSIFWLVITIVTFGMGIAFIVGFFTGGNNKELKKSMQNIGLTEEVLEQDLKMGIRLRNLQIGRKYSLYMAGKVKLLVHDKLLWAYIKQTHTKHKVYGFIPAGTTVSYAVHVFDYDQKTCVINVAKEEQAEEVLEELKKAAPHILLGYTDEIAQMATSNFADLVNMVEQRKYQ